MEAFASFWWLYLTVAVLGYGYAVYNWYKRVRRISDDGEKHLSRNVTRGLALVIVISILAASSLNALVVSALYWLIVAVTG